jgi:hypothetical protein
VKSLVTTMVIVALATPAYAQLSTGGAPGGGAPSGPRPSLTLGGDKNSKTKEELDYEKQRDDAYKSGLSKIPDKKANADPWGSVRGAATTPPKPNQQRPGSK